MSFKLKIDLSTNRIFDILSNKPILNDNQPIFQIISILKRNNKYVIFLNDGRNYYKGCLIKENDLVSKIDNEEIDELCIIKLIDYNVIEFQKVITIEIKNLKVLAKGEFIKFQLGEPTKIDLIKR